MRIKIDSTPLTIYRKLGKSFNDGVKYLKKVNEKVTINHKKTELTPVPTLPNL